MLGELEKWFLHSNLFSQKCSTIAFSGEDLNIGIKIHIFLGGIDNDF